MPCCVICHDINIGLKRWKLILVSGLQTCTAKELSEYYFFFLKETIYRIRCLFPKLKGSLERVLYLVRLVNIEVGIVSKTHLAISLAWVK